MQKVLPLLIEQAEDVRDRQAQISREAALQHQQAVMTLARLQEFRRDSIARSPAVQGSRADAQSLMDYQRFMTRLDEAIGLQQAEGERRRLRSEEAQRRLLALQQRVMAFETLAGRQAATAAAQEARRDQREADEFAARAARRFPAGGFAA